MAAQAQADREAASSASEERELRVSELGAAFRALYRSLGRLRGRDTHLGAGELSHAQFELLVELWEHGELPVGELAAAARLAPGSVTQMLEGLEAWGHVERARSTTDRRVVVTRMTRAGRAKVEARRAAWKERWEHALDGLDADQLRAGAEVIERLGEMLDAAPALERSERTAGGGKSPVQGARA